MKTITLTDEAYHRLKSWKTEPSESFSKVVLKAVPKRGTAADMEEGFARLPALTKEQAQIVAESLARGNDWRQCPDPWTTPGGMLAFAPFHGFIWGMSAKVSSGWGRATCGRASSSQAFGP